MRHTITGLTAFAALLLAAPLAGAADTYDYFTADNVSKAITDIGGTEIKVETEGGSTYVRFKHSGYPISAGLQVCKDRPGCVGLVIAAGINTAGTKYPLELLNKFNQKLPPITALSLDDGNVGIWRALISLGGVTEKNVGANIGMLISYVPTFVEHLQTGLVVASTDAAPGRAVPVSTAPAIAPFELSAKQMQEISKDWAIAQDGKKAP